MDTEFAKWLATLGVGGTLAAFMFWFYRKDVRQFTDLWEMQTTMLMDVVRENTQSNTRLVTMLEDLHARMERNGFFSHNHVDKKL